MTPVQTIETLKTISGNNDKVAALVANSSDVLKKILYYAYEPSITFGIKAIPKYHKDETPIVDIADVFHVLDELVARRVTGNQAIASITRVLQSLKPGHDTVFEGIIERDLKIKMGASLINKAFKGLISTFELMACHTLNVDTKKHLKFPCYVQKKYDAARVAVIVNRGVVTYMTRNGKVYNLNNSDMDKEILDAVRNSTYPSHKSHLEWVFDGELYAVDANGKELNRQTSNGIANKLIHGTASDAEQKMMRIALWDVIHLESFKAGKCASSFPYSTRYEFLTNTISNKCSFVHVAETKICNTLEEVLAESIRYMSLGFEGIIAKNTDGVWQAKRVYDCLKVKAEIESEFFIRGMEIGTGKNAGRLGNLLLESSDGIVKASCGIFKGHPESIRDVLWNNQDEYIDKVVTILHNGLITNKDGTYSVFLPRYIETRFDKDEADSFEKIKNDSMMVSV